MTPFTFINSINDHKEIEVTKEYSQFLTNRFFSLFQDTVFIANHANGLSKIDNYSQYKYYLNLISKRKRFTKWPKGNDVELINMICEYYDFSIDKALEALKILNDKQKQEIMDWYKERCGDDAI